MSQQNSSGARVIIVPTGKLKALSTANALVLSLQAFVPRRQVVSVKCTSVSTLVADALLAIRDLSRLMREESQVRPYPTIVYPKTLNNSSTDFARLSSLLTFLLTEREAGYPCIIDAGVRRTTCTERPSRISPLTAVADTIRIASGDHSPSERGPEIKPPALDRANVDSLRSLAHHWIRPLDGLNLAKLLDRGFTLFQTAFTRWDSGNWYDRHHWRSFYALCLWFSHLPDPVPPRNSVQPGNACWKQWGRLLGLLYEGRTSEAANLFDESQQALKRCLRWI